MTTETEGVSALVAIHEHGEQVRQRELETALQKLDDIDDDQRAAIETLSERLVASVLEPPTHSLLTAADADETVVTTALSLFDGGLCLDCDAASSTPNEESVPDLAPAQD